MSTVIIGVDPHKLSATIEVLDDHEQLLGAGRFATDQAGYAAMRTYVKAWPDRVWAVEGANGAGRPLAQRLLERQGFRSLMLTHSFRWQTDEQASLANGLRSGASTTLPGVEGEHVADLDIVLASKWASLWELGPRVFPIGFQSFKGGPEEAAAILVLNHVTRSLFSTDAIYVKEAVTALAIVDEDFFVNAEPRLQQIVDVLSRDATPAQLKAHVKTAYRLLSELVADYSPRELKPVRANYTNRLRDIQTRLLHPTRPVPGLTAHQAKGAEWNVVGVCLDDSERIRLASGLSVESETDRRLYVACTRARARTVEVVGRSPICAPASR